MITSPKNTFSKTASHVAIIATDINGTITVFNEGAERLLSYTASEIIGKQTPIIFHTESDIKEQQKLLKEIYGETYAGFEIIKKLVTRDDHKMRAWTYVDKNNISVKTKVSVSPIHDSNKNVTGFLFMAMEVPGAEKIYSIEGNKFEEISKTILEELPNQQSFEENLDLEIRRMQRDQNPLSLIKMNVDRFKLYEKKYDTELANETLKKIAYTLSQRIKRAGDMLGYYGKDEFAVVLPNTDESGAVKVAEQLRFLILDLNIQHETCDVNSFVTISLGVVSTIPDKNTTLKTLLTTANTNLKQAKADGRNCTRIFSK